MKINDNYGKKSVSKNETLHLTPACGFICARSRGSNSPLSPLANHFRCFFSTISLIDKQSLVFEYCDFGGKLIRQKK